MKAHISFRLLAAALVAFAVGPVKGAPPVTFDLLVTLDYPGASRTFAYGINDGGKVAGQFFNSTGTYGFIYAGSHFSSPISDPNDRHHTTAITGINNPDTLCGYYTGTDTYLSFLVTGTTFSPIVTGLAYSEVLGVNDADNVCGTAMLLTVGFVVIDGTLTTFTIPGADMTIPEGLNNLNECVGSYTIAGVSSGFLREPDGTLIYPIAAAGKTATVLHGIDDKGEMVGAVGDSDGIHAAYFQSSTKYATWDYPGSEDPATTYFTGINKRGQISGFTVNPTGDVHGFIVRKGGGP